MSTAYFFKHGMKRPLSCLSAIFLFLFSLQLQAATLLGKDHGPVSPDHVGDAQEFVDRYFLESGSLSISKLADFEERLQKEKQSLAEDMYETELAEGLELDSKEYAAALKKAKKLLDQEKNKFTKIYNDYLIPKIQALQDLAESGSSVEAAQGLIDDFIRGYISFYVPNAKRNMWPQDVDGFHFAKHFFHPYVFKKGSEKAVEANNLVVEKETKREISECLKVEVALGHFVNNEEITALKDCGFDISRLNPGVSALWKKNGKEDIEKIYDPRPELFPTPEDKIYFDKVKLSGFGSPKIDATYMRDGEERKVKIKMGTEVHSENVTSLIGRFLGLNQDLLLYRDKVKVYLGDSSYDQFVAQFNNKYGQARNFRYVDSHGGPKGNEWVILEDVVFEVSAPEEVRLASLDTESWDLLNRREYRSMLLWYAWFNIIDTRTDNFKASFLKTKQGLVPVHKLQDVGFSLGPSIMKGELRKSHRMIGNFQVNQYEDSVVDGNEDRDSITIYWNDFANYKTRFSTTTWNDLKWMARNIGKIGDKEIYYALKASGMPEEVRDLYRHKIVSRRNEILEAFGLENEYEILSVPDLRTYSPNEYIRNGQFIGGKIEGHHEFLNDTNMLVNILGVVANAEIPFAGIEKNLFNNLQSFVSGGLVGLGGLTTDLGIKFDTDNNLANQVSTTSVSPGIAIFAARTVGTNKEVYNSGGKALPYYVKDTFAVEINVNSEFFTQIAQFLPVNIQAGLRLYRKEFQFIHHTDSIKKGYLSPFRLFNIVAAAKSYAAYGMQPLEVVKISDSYGFELEGGVSAFNVGPIFTNEISGAIGWRKVTPIYFTRDQFGALHVYKEKTTEIYGGLHFHLAQFNPIITTLPLLGMEFTHRRFFHEAVDYSFLLPAYDLGATVLDQLQRKKDFEALNDFFVNGYDEEDPEAVVRKNFHLKARGARTKRSLAFLYFFGQSVTNGHSTAKIKFSEGNEHVFNRYYIKKRKTDGIDTEGVPYLEDFLVKDGTASKISVEMEGKNPDNFVATIRVMDYYRKRSKKQLESFIETLNSRYSEGSDQPFYRNYLLPESDEVNLYRKIYGSHRVFVNGAGLLEKARTLSVEEAGEIGKKFFESFIVNKRDRRNFFKFAGQKVNLRAKTNRFIKAFKKLRIYAKSSSPSPRYLVEATAEFLASTYTEVYGTNLLRELLGPENVFVMGEIYGVYRSFNTLNKTEPNAERRFAGKSWGTYAMVPPIQKFLYNFSQLPPSVLINVGIPNEEIYGELPRLVAPSN